jgi:hypothetical protein
MNAKPPDETSMRGEAWLIVAAKVFVWGVFGVLLFIAHGAFVPVARGLAPRSTCPTRSVDRVRNQAAPSELLRRLCGDRRPLAESATGRSSARCHSRMSQSSHGSVPFISEDHRFREKGFRTLIGREGTEHSDPRKKQWDGVIRVTHGSKYLTPAVPYTALGVRRRKPSTCVLFEFL